jgi:hypothetical protein
MRNGDSFQGHKIFSGGIVGDEEEMKKLALLRYPSKLSSGQENLNLIIV